MNLLNKQHMSMAFLFFYARWIHYSWRSRMWNKSLKQQFFIESRISELSKRLSGIVWRKQSERKLIEKLLFELVNLFSTDNCGVTSTLLSLDESEPSFIRWSTNVNICFFFFLLYLLRSPDFLCIHMYKHDCRMLGRFEKTVTIRNVEQKRNDDFFLLHQSTVPFIYTIAIWNVHTLHK